MTTTALAYPTSQTNRDFRIKVNGVTEDGTKVNVLVGVSGLIRYFGVEFANKFLKRAYADYNHDNTTCKLRRGIKVTFYSK